MTTQEQMAVRNYLNVSLHEVVQTVQQHYGEEWRVTAHKRRETRPANSVMVALVRVRASDLPFILYAVREGKQT